MSYEHSKTEHERNAADDAISDGYRVGDTSWKSMIARREYLRRQWLVACVTGKADGLEEYILADYWRQYHYHSQRIVELRDKWREQKAIQAQFQQRRIRRKFRIAQLRAHGLLKTYDEQEA